MALLGDLIQQTVQRTAPNLFGQYVNIASNSDLDRQAYNQIFAGTKMAGQFDNLVAAAQQNGVPPSLMAAIIAHESAKGTSRMINQKNNPAGLMDPATGMSTGRNFPSIEEGINAAGITIGRNYRRGGESIPGMALSYAPVGAANDPRGLNTAWPIGVANYQRQLSGSGGGGAQPGAPVAPAGFNPQDSPALLGMPPPNTGPYSPQMSQVVGVRYEPPPMPQIAPAATQMASGATPTVPAQGSASDFLQRLLGGQGAQSGAQQRTP